MEPTLLSFLWSVLIIGTVATLVMDLWGLFLKYTFKIPSLDYRYVGRWVGLFRLGVFKHAKIMQAPEVTYEKPIGWFVHYLTGYVFATLFLFWQQNIWSLQSLLLSALTFGAVTLIFPFFIMQPCFGFGVAGANLPTPWKARFKSLGTHLSFGLGLYLGTLVANSLWQF